jgi:uncharacterized iron-regulated protein
MNDAVSLGRLGESVPMINPTRLFSVAALAAAFLALGACASSASSPSPRHAFFVDSLIDGPSNWTELAKTIDAADVVYVGESHDDRGHHELEYLVLEQMSKGSGPVLLGMEMFQRPYQEHLDAYVAGDIDENEMLRRTEYFGRWRYDSSFYSPLWRLCREKGIRIVALNAPAEVQKKIGREGLDALTPDERAQIAAEHVLDDEAYNERTRAIFNRVHPLPEPNLSYLVQAQTNWDETMAESGALALEEAGPGARMLVVAGSLHIRGRFCIPGRLARRLPGLEHVLLVGVTEGRGVGADDGEWTEKDADYVAVFTNKRPGLGARLEATDGGGLKILSLVPNGTAALAGLLPGDVITALDRRPVRDIVDLRQTLDHRRPGDVLSCFAQRDGSVYSFTLHLRPVPPQPQPTLGDQRP